MPRHASDDARLQAVIYSQELQHFSYQVNLALRTGDYAVAKRDREELQKVTLKTLALIESISPHEKESSLNRYEVHIAELDG
jgi:hypothetical protein